MSKYKSDTEEKILSMALEMFNEKGIEYVGMRELASVLNIRVSNINYYFPTKDDLVNRLSLDLSQLNARIVTDDSNLTVASFLDMFQKVFRNHLAYRCLLLSFVHLMEQNKKISERYKQTQENRNTALRQNLLALVRNGYLHIKEDGITDFLVAHIALIARFWISEAAISQRNLSPEEQIKYYVQSIGKLLEPYLTEKGTKQLQNVLR